MADLSRRLQRLENDAATLLQRQPLCTVRYTNGDTETKRFLPYLFDVFTLYTAGEPLPKVDGINLLFDTQKHGKLPELLLYMLSK